MSDAATKAGGKCPSCGKPTESRYRPFCSQRCQQLDLGRWLNENYRIAAKSGPADASEGSDDNLD
ncbi:MAG TPA: DNA gyrase inhibitor YacG [Dongiaceae bacterium]